MLLINPYRFAAPRSSDADVNSYILAVESADGQQLEEGVISAVESFILGCKSDGIWSALKASCIIAGARTLSGALVPLVGTAPTNFNFVTGDYNRETGLKSNGSTKYLTSNRNNNADPQDSKHLSVFVSEKTTIAGRFYIGGTTNTTGNSYLSGGSNLTNGRAHINVNSSVSNIFPHEAGFFGSTRNNSTDYQSRNNGASITTTAISSDRASYIFRVFGRHNSVDPTNARLSFYSIGESIDLALLDTRVSTLMADIAAAIPRAPVSDVDALAYIAAVETADAQTLEDSVKFAYEDFIVGCKTDGIWSVIKASCILAGARTLAGALKPLAGPAPTNLNFVSGDYDRKTGLLSNGTTKRLNSNQADNADPQNSKHFAVFSTTLIGSNKSYGGHGAVVPTNLNSTNGRVRNTSALSMGGIALGFKGISRDSNLLVKGRSNSTNYENNNLVSSTPTSTNFGIFTRSITISECDCRIAYYSIGESLNLALLDTRVSNLMTALAASNI